MQSITIDELQSLVSYDPETGFLWWKPRPNGDPRFASKRAFTSKKTSGHLTGRVRGMALAAHRAAWAIYHGEWPEQIDHINGDPADNRLSNLRSVSASVNCRNKRLQSNSRHGHFGLRRQGNRWQARIKVCGQLTAIGTFDTYEEAVAARKAKEVELGFGPNHGRTANPSRSL